jgi:hypothetical protein
MDDDEANGAMPAAPAADAAAGAGTKLCINVAQDGSLTFYVEQDGQPAAQEQPASDIGQALKMALDAYKQLGQRGDVDQQFDQGFGAEQGSARRQGFFK